MKVVIIGGGIAGLTLGIFLKKKNVRISNIRKICRCGEQGPWFPDAYRWVICAGRRNWWKAVI
jgi:hypothetical protein